MLVVKCEEYLREVMAKAEEMGIKDKLQESLDYLADYGCQGDPGKVRCSLYKDFAPLSFGFVWERRKEDGTYTHWMSGGLIYWDNEKSWSTHT